MARAAMLFPHPILSLADFEATSGWHLQPEGLCRGDVCVPFPSDALTTKQVQLEHVAKALNMPLVHEGDLTVLGPWAAARALQTAEAPDIRLPDHRGETFDLATLRGTKVLLLAWASW